ncbi:Cutinase transcription factor 1 beta [Madurella mycetomatis]|uniref:Cutinase transcription factor 1 beta n=1 Tax=Madurella mycetomatis TaxID=100816 RepID=A0A175WGI3_9PEZI|nr:Cutinase transcription factor 1 beta [Madurella mycetomatis]
MTRSKPSHLPTAFLSSLAPDDRRAMERAASILQIPIASLLSASSQAEIDASKPTQNSVNLPIVDTAPDDEDASDATGDNLSRGSKDSSPEGGVVPWHSTAEEFDKIDGDIARGYATADFWPDDFPFLAPEAAQALTPNANGTILASMALAYPLQQAWNHPQKDMQRHQHPLGPRLPIVTPSGTTGDTPITTLAGNATLDTLHQPWEIIENPFKPVSRQLPVDQRCSEWATNGRVEEAKAPAAHKCAPTDALRFVSVDPLHPQALPRPQRRGPFEDRERQEQTSRTRGLKACVRCRMQKIRCNIVENDPTGICGTCLAVSTQKLHYLPCLRHRLTECTLYRTGKGPGLEFTFRWPVMRLKDISEWASPRLRTILVQSDICEVPLKLVVREFVPIPHKDEMRRSWMDYRKGIKKFKKTTPYAIVNMRNAVEDMREYVTTNVFKCMDFFLRGSDVLVKETYKFARKHMQQVESDEERKLLGNFFRLWFGILRTATTEHIVGEDTLDMEPETEDKSFPLFGKVPLPSVMIQQLDMILTLGILDPLRKQVLEDFQKLALMTNPRNWMTIYLTTFMSLHSCAKITAENYRNARKHGLLRRYAIPNFIAERHHSANVFLSHYHYRTESCNPFKQDWKRRHATPFAHMSVDDIQFLERTKVLLKEKEPIIKTNKEHDLYEHELYFISQMFEENWQPRDTAIDYAEGTVNNVGLKQYAGDAEREREKVPR